MTDVLIQDQETLDETALANQPDSSAVLEAVHALASGGRFTDYVSYSQSGRCSFAGCTQSGGTEVTLTSEVLRWCADGVAGEEPLGSQPFHQLGDLLTRHGVPTDTPTATSPSTPHT